MTGREVCPTCQQERSLSGGCWCDFGPATVLGLPVVVDRSMPRDVVQLVSPTHRRTVLVPRPDRPHRSDVEGCLCGRPTRDRAFVCEACLDELAAFLRRVGEVNAELVTTRMGERGVDYRRLGGAKGGNSDGPGPSYGAAVVPLVINPAALAARDGLRSTLRGLVVSCLQYRVAHTSPREDVPSSWDVPGMAAWLMWRLDGMAWHQVFDTARWDVEQAVTHAERVAMPTARHYLGRCEVCGKGAMLASTDDDTATCDNRDCGASQSAQALRDNVLSAYLADRLYPMAECARLAVWLGGLSTDDPKVVGDRFKKWRQRGELHPDAHRLTHYDQAAGRWRDRRPLFRFGHAYGLLVLRDKGAALVDALATTRHARGGRS